MRIYQKLTLVPYEFTALKGSRAKATARLGLGTFA